MKPYGKLAVFRNETPQWDPPSDHKAYASLESSTSRFEVHEHLSGDPDETLGVILALVKNLSTGVDELSDKVQKSMRFFDVERIERELFTHNEQFLKNLIQAQTTVIVDRVVAGLSHKVTEGLSGYLTQVLNQEKKSSELLLNSLNHRFRALDDRYEKLERSILNYTHKIEMKIARASLDLESARSDVVSTSRHVPRESSFRNANAVKTSDLRQPAQNMAKSSSFNLQKSSFGILAKIADGIMKVSLTLLANPAILLLVFVLGLVGWQVSHFFRGRPVTQMTRTVSVAPEKRTIPAEQKETRNLAQTEPRDEEDIPAHSVSRERKAEKTSSVAKDLAALEDLLPKTRELSSLREAALLGDGLAIYEMGVRFLSGVGVKRTPELATRLFEKAVDYNSPFAAYQLASQYEKGVGVGRDIQKSLALYEQAAHAGHVKAMHNLGVLMAAGGAGGKPDYSKAAEWFRKAADHGLKDSQYNLGLLLAHGLGGPQDRVEAYKWFDLAGQQNDAESIRKRDMVAKKMSSTDIALARVRISQWQAKASELMRTEGASALPWSSKNGLPVSKASQQQ